MEQYAFKPCFIHRGGATLYFRLNADMHFTVMRGRWLSPRSARIYIEDGLACLVSLPLSEWQVASRGHSNTCFCGACVSRNLGFARMPSLLQANFWFLCSVGPYRCYQCRQACSRSACGFWAVLGHTYQLIRLSFSLSVFSVFGYGYLLRLTRMERMEAGAL